VGSGGAKKFIYLDGERMGVVGYCQCEIKRQSMKRNQSEGASIRVLFSPGIVGACLRVRHGWALSRLGVK